MAALPLCQGPASVPSGRAQHWLNYAALTSKPVVNTNVGGGSGGYRIRGLRCCTRDGGWWALRSLPAGGGFKAPCAAAVTAVRGERHGKGALSACQLGTGKMVGNICRGRVERCKATSEPGLPVCPGKSLGETRYCPGGVRHTGSMSPVQALVWNVRRWRPEVTPVGGEREDPKRLNPRGAEYRSWGALADCLVGAPG